MSNGGDLLRMLMPAVSPVPIAGARPAKPPIESLSFDSLLADARQPDSQINPKLDSVTGIDSTAATDNIKQPDPTAKIDALAPLTGIESIQNASLRRIVAEATGK